MVTKPGARKGPIRPSWWRIGASWAIRVVILVIGKLRETHWLRISSDLKEACKNHFCCTSGHIYPIISIMKSLTFAGLFGDLCLGSGRVGRGNDPHWVFMGGNGGSGGTQQEETNPSFSTNLLKICRATHVQRVPFRYSPGDFHLKRRKWGQGWGEERTQQEEVGDIASDKESFEICVEWPLKGRPPLPKGQRWKK